MIAEFGHFALIIALSLALAQTLVPAWGVFRASAPLMNQAPLLATLQFAFLCVAFLCLTIAFVTDDFSVRYVASNSNTQMPLLYKISGVWGAHEGSLLLWTLMAAGWAAAVARLSARAVPTAMLARVISALGVIHVGFLLFTILTSNPFERLPDAPAEGRELNPLLQDFGLAIHPPMLYMGYVGFSVAFAFTIAALWSGKMDTAWARWTRQWASAAWLFLTVGIALGSWWAYYELGWGGWWFWDPVENASFMPWLAGTALIHSLAVTEARGAFRAWTAFLALLTFSLSLLGAFIVRSGILTSVHAFATDPERGLFILTILALVVGGSLTLYAARAPLLRRLSHSALLSREGGILLNNILLSSALLAVFIGTLYPLFLDALGLGKISVGAPYFNMVFAPLTAPLAVLSGVFVVTRWKKDTFARIAKTVSITGALAIAVGCAAPLLFARYHIGAAVGFALAAWVTLANAHILAQYWRARARPALTVIGMVCGHVGLGAFIAGVSAVSSYGIEKDARLAPGESYTVGEYKFAMTSPAQTLQVENYQTQMAEIEVRAVGDGGGDGELIATLYPEKRRYVSQEQPLTEAAIDVGLFRDVYVSLGEPLAQQAWSARLQIKPLVRWIWGGAALMAAGALLAIIGRRRRDYS